MNHDNRTEYVTRNSILNALSDDEITRVISAETLTHLSDGDEYLDLTQLDRGVQQAFGTTTPMNRVLSKKAVLQDTWDKILKQSPAARTGALPSAAP